jgi:hypothetical protein
MQVSPLRQTMKPLGSGRDEKFGWGAPVEMKILGGRFGRDDKVFVGSGRLETILQTTS